jgi:hypothetical protein
MSSKNWAMNTTDMTAEEVDRVVARVCCEKCGEAMDVGEWPFCPHGKPEGFNVIDDTLPGGARWVQNLGHQPVWVETKTQMQRELDSRGLRLKESPNRNRRDRSPWASRTRLR